MDYTTLTTTPNTLVYTADITTGVPPIALSGSAGFIKADAAINVEVQSGCDTAPCKFRAQLYSPDYGYMNYWYSTVTLQGAGARAMMPITGVARVGSGNKQIQLLMWQNTGTGIGTGTARAFGDITLSYYPFGGTGNDVMAPSPQGGTPSGDPNRAR